jgi:hypothetical protein
MRIYLADPVTRKFTEAVDNPTEFPLYFTVLPPPLGLEDKVFLIDGMWSFDDPNTPEIEKLIIPITNVALNTTKEGNIWVIPTEQKVVLTAITAIPVGTFRAIVELIVGGVVKEDLRFQANITEGALGVNTLTLPLYFKNSGNYQISAERLNKGLDEIGAPFHVKFDKIDIDVIVNIPE